MREWHCFTPKCGLRGLGRVKGAVGVYVYVVHEERARIAGDIGGTAT